MQNRLLNVAVLLEDFAERKILAPCGSIGRMDFERSKMKLKLAELLSDFKDSLSGEVNGIFQIALVVKHSGEI